MGSITFNYKNDINVSYAPGFANKGKSGAKGIDGTNGTALFFIDYDLNNDYNISNALHRIEKNMSLLSTSNDKISKSRDYKEGDLIISSMNNCYEITKADGKFGIKFLGTIKKSGQGDENIKIDKLVVYDITGLTINYTKDGSTGSIRYNSMLDSHTLNNRMYTSNNTVEYNVDSSIYDECIVAGDFIPYKNYGVWYKIVLKLSIMPAYMTYTVSIDLPNEKSLNLNSLDGHSFMALGEYDKSEPAVTILTDILKFNKKLEFIVSPINKNPDTSTYNTFLFGDICDSTNKASTIYMSDTTCDYIHPSNNNIKCSYSNGKYICDTSYNMNDISDASIYNYINNRDNTSLELHNSFLSFSELYKDGSTSIVNTRGGESAYFSTMDTSAALDKIHDYISNSLFTISCTNNVYNTVNYFKDVPTVFDNTTYKNKSFTAVINNGIMESLTENQ